MSVKLYKTTVENCLLKYVFYTFVDWESAALVRFFKISLNSPASELQAHWLGSLQTGKKWTKAMQPLDLLSTTQIEWRLFNNGCIFHSKVYHRVSNLQWHSHAKLTLTWNTSDMYLDKFPPLWGKTHYDAVTLIASIYGLLSIKLCVFIAHYYI